MSKHEVIIQWLKIVFGVIIIKIFLNMSEKLDMIIQLLRFE